jgi:hypothetical protein
MSDRDILIGAYKVWKRIIDAYDSAHDSAALKDSRRSENAINKYLQATSNFSDGFVTYMLAWDNCPNEIRQRAVEDYGIKSPYASIGIPDPQRK